MSKPFLKVSEDFTDQVNDIVKAFKRDSVLVGIPAEETNRDPAAKADGTPIKDGGEEPLNNATLLAINEFGSPGQNIPPRQVMAIGIRNAQDQIAEEFKKAAKNALSQGLPALRQYYERAGIIASTSIKKAINAQEGIDEPAESTLRARRAAGFKGTKALIVTGQLRNSITYVVKG